MKKFIVENRFFESKSIQWIVESGIPEAGLRSIGSNLPMTILEAETFQDMLNRERHISMGESVIYRIEHDL
jgi:hypothetical protein